MGSKRSGVRAYAQSHVVRITAYLSHDDDTGRDNAVIEIGSGYSSYFGSRRLKIHDVSSVARALDSGDERFDRIWERIEAEFAKLDVEAPRALKRAERRQRQSIS
jgi:hypothetical protein